MITRAISDLLEKKNLSDDVAQGAMDEIMEGKATPAQIAGFLVGLRMKGETVNEIVSLAKILRSKAKIVYPKADHLVDTCGTGGDRSGTFNISTTAALVAAGAGAHVAKHGNRSVSSQSGSADVLEALGVRISIEPNRARECIEKAGMGFLFAPNHHPSMKHAAPVRKELGVRTVFNLLGPLSNPANAPAQVLGTYSEELVEVFAKALKDLGTTRALVVHCNGLDEIGLHAKTSVCELHNGNITRYQLDPADFGMDYAPIESLKGGNAQENAQITKEILAGKTGPRRDAVLLNAAAALVVCGVAKDMKEGIQKAEDSIDSGKANAVLTKMIAFTNEGSQ